MMPDFVFPGLTTRVVFGSGTLTGPKCAMTMTSGLNAIAHAAEALYAPDPATRSLR